MDIGGVSGGGQPQRAGGGPLFVGKGDVLKALVVEVVSENKAVLEVAGRTITASTAFSLAGMKGKAVLLRSLGSGPSGELVLKLAGEAGQADESQTESLIAQMQGQLESDGATRALFGRIEDLMLEAFSAGEGKGTLSAGQKQALGGLILRMLDAGEEKNFGERLLDLLSAAEPFLDGAAGGDAAGQEKIQKLLGAISGLFPEVGGLTAESLAKAVNDSGILLESKLLANLSAQVEGSPAAGIKGPEKEKDVAGDLKALLLKLRVALGGGEQPLQKTPGMVDGLLRDMRAFQFMSKLTGSLYGFLPVRWEGLKDGRAAFKPGGQDGGSCLINLDLEGLGKIAVSVFMRGGEFYVTLRVQDPSFRQAMDAEVKNGLAEAFSAQGLPLRSVNVTDYEDSPKNHLEFPGSGEHLVSIML